MLRSAVIHIVVFAILFNAVSFFRELSLLPSDDNVAPGFTLPVLASEAVFDKSQLHGKNTVVYFFAPWCHVCHASIGNLENLWQDKKDDINVIAIALSYDSANEVAEFVADKQLSFPVLLGTNELMTQYQVEAFPSYYVFDEQGRIKSKSLGYSTELGLRIRAM
ncbi:MAG: peroxiredoxin [Phenylobacterium sp.]|jgi:peroxiredoxin